LMWNQEAIWWAFPFHHQSEMEKQFAFVKLCCDILFVIYSHDDALRFSLSFMIQKSCTPFGALGEFPFKKKQCCILHSALNFSSEIYAAFCRSAFCYWLLDILKRVLSSSTGVRGIDVYWFIDFYSMCSDWNQSFILQTQTSVCEFCSPISHSTKPATAKLFVGKKQIVAG
jgi:hypothetical protein